MRLALTVAIALCAGQAAAAEPTARVGFADLDLTSSAGKTALEGRIRRAAAAVCSGNLYTGTRLGSAKCESDARDEIRALVDKQIARASARENAGQQLAATDARTAR
jgi:UrcA family protein